MTTALMTQLGYVVAAGLFIFGLKMLGSPATARRGNMVSAIGMLVAIVAARRGGRAQHLKAKNKQPRRNDVTQLCH